MNFNSYLYILIFLPFTVFCYYFIARMNKYRLCNIFLLVTSIIFYLIEAKKSIIFLLLNVVMNYCFYLLMLKRKNRLILVVSIINNILFLFLKNFALIRNSLLFPLAFSFVSFTQISFLIDTYRGEVPEYNFIDYSLYILYFPKLIQGPISYHYEILPDLIDDSKKKIDWNNMLKGVFLFFVGLAKKSLIANVFGAATKIAFDSILNYDATNIILSIICFSIYIYFDFSSYSDMAIGSSLLFNIRLPINFDSPYKASSIKDFWRRWHITFNRFLTKYVYIPLGGNRKGKVRTSINVLVVFLISGVWHGLSSNYIIWGIFNAVLLLIDNNRKRKIDGPANYIYMTLFVSISWLLFNLKSIYDFSTVMKNVLRMNFGPINETLVNVFVNDSVSCLLNILNLPYIASKHYLLIYLFISMICLYFADNSNSVFEKKHISSAEVLLIVIAAVFSILDLTKNIQFVYRGF